MILGNDIYSGDGTVDWDIYKRNSNFVILKASEGVGFTDPSLHFGQSEARRVALPLGYFHFARPDLNNSGQAEADWFLQTVNIKEGEFLALDYEPKWSGDAVAWSKAFCDEIASKLSGYRCLFYSYQDLVTRNNFKPVVDSGNALWIAAPTGSPLINTFKTGSWPFAAMQQWGNQKVPGVQGNVLGVVDADVFFGDLIALDKYCYHAPLPLQPIPPVPTPCEILLSDANQAIVNRDIQINQLIADKVVLQTQLIDAQKNTIQKLIDYLNGILHPAPKTP